MVSLSYGSTGFDAQDGRLLNVLNSIWLHVHETVMAGSKSMATVVSPAKTAK